MIQRNRTRVTAVGVLFSLTMVSLLSCSPALAWEIKEGGPAPEQPSREPRLNCLDCLGSGKLLCLDCAGKTQIEGPCDSCRSLGVVACSSCSGSGVKRCGRCKGRGRLEVVEVGRGGGTTWQPCSPNVRCSVCKGAATQLCKACKGHGTVNVSCKACFGKGAERCARCAGEGSLVDMEAVERGKAEKKLAVEVVQSQLQRLNSAARSIAGLAQKSAELRATFDRLEAPFQALKAAVEALPPAESLPMLLRGSADVVRREWTWCETAHEKSTALIARARSLHAAGGLAPLPELMKKLEAQPKQAEFLEEDIKLHEERATDYSSCLQELDGELRSLSRNIPGCRGQHDELKESVRKEAVERAQAGKEDAEKKKAFQASSELIQRLGEQLGIGQLQVALLPSKSVRELTVEIGCFDGGTEVSENAVDPLPREGVLQALPGFISGVLQGSPQIRRIVLRISASGTGDTGLDVRTVIQRFTIDRSRWTELMTGKYRNEWSTLLSKSSPQPAYPRPSSSLPDGMVLLLLVVIFILAMSVLAIARSRMLR